jgi:hypothetical protein
MNIQPTHNNNSNPTTSALMQAKTLNQNQFKSTAQSHYLLQEQSIIPLTQNPTDTDKWNALSIENNQQIERNLATIAANSDAAHKTIDALLSNIVKCIIRLEGNELKAVTHMIKAYNDPEVEDFSDVGQLGIGGFTRILDNAVRGEPKGIRANQEKLTIREKTTAYYALINSPYFSQSMEKIQQNSQLRQSVKDIIDIQYLDKKASIKTISHSPKQQEKAFTLYDYTNDQGFKSFTQDLSALRYLKPTAASTWTTAEKLKLDGYLTKRELEYAKLNPLNRPDRVATQFNQNTSLVSSKSLELDHIIVQRGNGFAVWNLTEGTDFLQQALSHHKPAVAGPSGTTDRFITAARLLGVGTKASLGLTKPLSAESSQKNSLSSLSESDQALIELMRWLSMAYLVDDQHHSMVEVSLAAYNHGLELQWGSELYTSPFSRPIHGKGFNISSESVIQQLSKIKDTPSHTEGYRTDLKTGSDVKQAAGPRF